MSMLRCIYSQSLRLDTFVTCLRRPVDRDGEGANNIVGYGTPMRSLYVHTHIELKQFDENMKGDSKLLITEATFGFRLLC